MKRVVFAGWMFFLFLGVLPTINAIDITHFISEYSLENAAKTSFTIDIESSKDDTFSIFIPQDSSVEIVSLDGLFVPYNERIDGIKKIISFPVDSKSKKIRIVFYTKQYLESGANDFFVAEINSKYKIDLLEAKLILPKNSVLTKSKKEGGSVFPEANIETDGVTLTLIWEKRDLNANDSFAMFVSYKTTNQILPFILLGILTGVFLLGVLVFLFYKKIISNKTQEQKNIQSSYKEGEREKRKPVEKEKQFSDDDSEGSDAITTQNILIDAKESIQHVFEFSKDKKTFYEHLKEDEQQIVNILSDRDGHIEQGTLVIITGFSKAYLSRLLAEMEARKIIFKQKRGKKNIIWLKK